MRGPLLAAAGGAMGGAGGPLARTIRDKLTAALQPTHLEVRDDSSRHGGPPGAETHFGVLVVSGRFAGLPLLQRHRLVHEALQAELAGPLHALQVIARTPEQWQSDPRAPLPGGFQEGATPRGRGGEGGGTGAAVMVWEALQGQRGTPRTPTLVSAQQIEPGVEMGQN